MKTENSVDFNWSDKREGIHFMSDVVFNRVSRNYKSQILLLYGKVPLKSQASYKH